MHASDHDGDDSAAGRVGLIRGILVIVTALAIGGFMVAQGLDRSGDTIAAADDVTIGDQTGDAGTIDESSAADGAAAEGEDAQGSAADGAATDGAAADSTTSPEATAEAGEGESGDATADPDQPAVTTGTDAAEDPAGPSSEVKVLVLNGAGAKGIAGRGTTMLSDAGYEVLAPKNADFLGPSKVYYLEGFEAEAQAVAAVFEVDPAAVVAPLDPSTKPISDIRDASVIVVIGQDGLIDV